MPRSTMDLDDPNTWPDELAHRAFELADEARGTTHHTVDLNVWQHRRRIKHTIFERRDQIAARKAKGSTGGRPPAFDAEIYKHRNTMK